MKTCDACDKPLQGGIGIGGAMLCRRCAEDVRAEIDSLRAQGKQVNAMGIARRIYRETHSAGNYLLRDVPEDLWNQAKQKSHDKGLSLREIILEALQNYLKK